MSKADFVDSGDLQPQPQEHCGAAVIYVDD